MFCPSCGSQIADQAVICVKCGAAANPAANPLRPGKSRLTYILLAIFLGWLGVHNFYAGYTGRAIAQLLISLLIGWLILPLFAVWIWIIVEICVVKQDRAGIAMT